MIQMHSYLVTNAKTELKFLEDKISVEEHNETFNQIAISMDNNNDLFDDNEFDFNIIFENENIFDETIDLEGIDNNNLEILNFIDLSANLFVNNKNSNNQDYEEESTIIDYVNLNFDINDLIDSFKNK